MAIHRDDLPMDMAEAIVAKFKEIDPGCRVVFGGDSTDPKHAEIIRDFERKADEAFFAGKCWSCGKESGVNIAEKLDAAEDDDEFDLGLPSGWKTLIPMGDGPFSIECPECHEKEPK